MKPRITLVQAPVFDRTTPSNGLALLFAHLKAAGFAPRLRDSSMAVYLRLCSLLGREPGAIEDFGGALEEDARRAARLLDEEAERLLAANPDVLGFSILTKTEEWSLELARRVKERAPSCLVLFGGAQCLRENMAFDFIRHPAVDLVAVGEADRSLPLLLDAVGRGWPADKPVPGILIKRGDRVLDGGDPPAVENLDELPFMDFSPFAMERYNGDAIYMSTSRGCVRSCAFCTHILQQKVYRTMSPARTAAEIRRQMDLYPGRSHVCFNDSLVNGDVRRLSELCDLLADYRLERLARRNPRPRMDFGWEGMAILHPTMTPRLLANMARSGCRYLQYGLESASQSVVDRIGKNFRVAEAERVIRDTRRAGIGVGLFIMVGFPGETEADFALTMGFLERHAPLIGGVVSSTCEIQLGSRLDREAAAFGVRAPLVDRVRWETADGSNTYAVRQDRLTRLNRLAERLGLGGGMRRELTYRGRAAAYLARSLGPKTVVV